MNPFSVLSVAMLLISLIASFVVLILIRRRRQELLSISLLVFVNYIVVQILSGIVHLSQIETADRGFYDMSLAPGNEAVTAAIAAILGLVGLSAGCLQARRGHFARQDEVSPTFWLSPVRRLLVAGILLVLLPLAVYSLIQVRQFVEDSGLLRVIAVDGGFGRFAIMSQWLVWVISFGVLLLVGARARHSALLTATVTGAGVVLIFMALSWTGGRSIAVFFAVPIFLTMLPRFRRLEKPTLVLSSIALIVFVVVTTQARLDTMQTSRGQVSFLNFIDWEWGRFSMSGFALQYVAHRGYLFGETYLHGILWTLDGIAKLFGLGLGEIQTRSSSEVAGYAIARSGDIFMVPGMTAEMILNFGVLGVPLIYYVLGRLAGFVDRKMEDSSHVLERLCFGFIGSVLAFRAMQSDSSALPSFLLYFGTPLFLTWWASSLVMKIIEDVVPRTGAARQKFVLDKAISNSDAEGA